MWDTKKEISENEKDVDEVMELVLHGILLEKK